MERLRWNIELFLLATARLFLRPSLSSLLILDNGCVFLSNRSVTAASWIDVGDRREPVSICPLLDLYNSRFSGIYSIELLGSSPVDFVMRPCASRKSISVANGDSMVDFRFLPSGLPVTKVAATERLKSLSTLAILLFSRMSVHLSTCSSRSLLVFPFLLIVSAVNLLMNAF